MTTSNSLDHTEKDDEIMLEHNAHVKDMEAAAIAWVVEQCYQSAVPPFLAIKVVTDIVDGDRPTHEEFLENLGTASHSLHDALLKVIHYLKDDQEWFTRQLTKETSTA